jgi:hypothetical protein
MNWNVVGAAADLAASLLVLASLVYLARQLRQANVFARAEAYRQTMAANAALLDSWGDNPSWAELFVKLRFQGGLHRDLTPQERAVAGMRLQSLVWSFAAIHHDVQLGILPESAYDSTSSATFRIPYMRELWPMLRPDHSPDFARFFEARFDLPSTSNVASALLAEPVLEASMAPVSAELVKPAAP